MGLCRTCGVVITADNGQPDARYTSGFRGTCKACASAKRHTKAVHASEPEPAKDVRGKRARQREFAPRKSDTVSFLEWLGSEMPREDYLLDSKSPSAFFDYPTGLYEEALDKDSHLASVLDQRKTAVLSLKWDIVPADASAQAEQAAEFCRQAFRRVSVSDGDAGFTKDLADMLDAVALGAAYSELLWDDAELTLTDKTKTSSKPFKAYIPTQLLSRHPRRFIYNIDSECRLLTKDEYQDGVALPPYKFLIFRPYARFENPYGTPVIRRIWWLSWFKRYIHQWWFQFCESYADPVAIAYSKDSTRTLTPEELKSVLDGLQNIQHQTGMVMPPGLEMMFREPSRYSSVTVYQSLIEYINGEISKAIIGQTMTTDAPKRGTYALGAVQERVAHGITTSDARALEALINGNLIPWLIEFNMPGAPMPRFEFNTDEAGDKLLQAQVVQILQQMGFEVSLSWMIKTFGIPPAQGDGDKLELPQLSAGPNGPGQGGDQKGQDNRTK